MVIRESEISPRVKYWVKSDIENRIIEGSITAHFNSGLLEIREGEVDIKTPEGMITIPNDFVLAMTGYRPHLGLMGALGTELSTDEKRMPVYNTQTLETNRTVLYMP